MHPLSSTGETGPGSRIGTHSPSVREGRGAGGRLRRAHRLDRDRQTCSCPCHDACPENPHPVEKIQA